MQHQYQKLKNSILKKINTGIYKPGDILPSEHELKDKYKMARFTVRQALDELVKEGLIIKHKGKGSIVSEKQRKALGIFSIKGFSAIVGEAGKVQTAFLKKPYKFKWGNDFFYPLTASEKAKGATCIERLRSVNENPVMLEYTYIPIGIIPLLLESDFINNSLFETLHQKFNITITRAEQELVATGATKQIANFFSIKAGTPVLHVYRKYHSNQPDLFIYSSFYCYTGKYSIGNVFL